MYLYVWKKKPYLNKIIKVNISKIFSFLSHINLKSCLKIKGMKGRWNFQSCFKLEEGVDGLFSRNGVISN